MDLRTAWLGVSASLEFIREACLFVRYLRLSVKCPLRVDNRRFAARMVSWVTSAIDSETMAVILSSRAAILEGEAWGRLSLLG